MTHSHDNTKNTNQSTNESTSDALHCQDFKAVLSAYLDDELARGERFRADAHLLSCTACRDLIEHAEQLDDRLRRDFAADLSDAETELATDAIDVRAMQARVLASIGAESRRTWIPRIAAAAAIVVISAGAVVFWRSRDVGASQAPAGVGEFARGEHSTRRDFDPTIAPPTKRTALLAALSLDDRQALYATSTILDAVRHTAFDDRARRAQLTEIARYDDLVDRLTEVLPKLPAEDRATVALARDATARLAESTDMPEEWSRLQEDVSSRELDVSVDELSDVEPSDTE